MKTYTVKDLNRLKLLKSKALEIVERSANSEARKEMFRSFIDKSYDIDEIRELIDEDEIDVEMEVLRYTLNEQLIEEFGEDSEVAQLFREEEVKTDTSEETVLSTTLNSEADLIQRICNGENIDELQRMLEQRVIEDDDFCGDAYDMTDSELLAEMDDGEESDDFDSDSETDTGLDIDGYLLDELGDLYDELTDDSSEYEERENEQDELDGILQDDFYDNSGEALDFILDEMSDEHSEEDNSRSLLDELDSDLLANNEEDEAVDGIAQLIEELMDFDDSVDDELMQDLDEFSLAEELEDSEDTEEFSVEDDDDIFSDEEVMSNEALLSSEAYNEMLNGLSDDELSQFLADDDVGSFNADTLSDEELMSDLDGTDEATGEDIGFEDVSFDLDDMLADEDESALLSDDELLEELNDSEDDLFADDSELYDDVYEANVIATPSTEWKSSSSPLINSRKTPDKAEQSSGKASTDGRMFSDMRVNKVIDFLGGIKIKEAIAFNRKAVNK